MQDDSRLSRLGDYKMIHDLIGDYKMIYDLRILQRNYGNVYKGQTK